MKAHILEVSQVSMPQQHKTGVEEIENPCDLDYLAACKQARWGLVLAASVGLISFSKSSLCKEIYVPVSYTHLTLPTIYSV